MAALDVRAYSLPELLVLHARAQQELGRRGLTRTSGSVHGELGEALALALYGGVLSPPGTKAYDLIDGEARRVQVKTRTLPSGQDRTFHFHELGFDLALCIRFDRASNEVEWAREYSVEEVQSLARPHSKGLRLSTGRARVNGHDVTDAVRAAYTAFG